MQNQQLVKLEAGFEILESERSWKEPRTTNY